MLAILVNQTEGNHVSVMFDLDTEGEKGVKQAVLELTKRCRVRLAWNSEIATDQFKRRQPELITKEESKQVF